MKKSLMALAVLGAMAGTASAQSSVTLYGIIDIGVQWNEVGVNRGTTAAPRWEQESTTSIDSGYQSGSRFGLRGSEALGRGWNAVFTLEAGYNPDLGTSGQGGRLFGRQAWAGLQSGTIGTFAFGRIAAPSSGTGSFDLWGAVDPFLTGFGAFNGGGVQLGLQGTFAPSAAQRYDNSVIYASPNWGGFRVAGLYSFNTNGQESVPSGTNQDAFSLAGSWAWGPLYLAATYDVIGFADPGFRNVPATATWDDQKMLQVGGTWDFKIVKIHGAYGDFSDLTPAGGVTVAGNIPTALIPVGVSQYDASAWMFGVSVPLFGGSLLASYQTSDADRITTTTTAGITSQFEPDYNIWGIAYTYPFSRRTNMYIAYGQREWDGTVTQNLQGNAALGQASQVFDQSGFALGIRHLF